MASSIKIPVFMDTNLQTHLAMAVSPDITAADLKREFGREHSICFPNVGETRVIALMVKRNSCFYRLPPSMMLKNVFQGRVGVWFLFIDVKLVSNSANLPLSNGLVGELGVSDCNRTNVTESQKAENHMEAEKKRRKMKRKKPVNLESLMEELLTPVYVGKKKKKKKKKWRVKEKKYDKVMSEGNSKFSCTTEEVSGISLLGNFRSFGNKDKSDHKEEHISQPIVETPTVSSSERVSVSGIITRYFPEFDDVKSADGGSGGVSGDEFGAPICDKRHLEKSSRLKTIKHSKEVMVHSISQTTKTPPRLLSLSVPAEPSAETSKEKFGRTEVGNRLVVAANDLKISTSNNKLANAICQSKVGKFSDSLVRNIVFDVSESDN